MTNPETTTDQTDVDQLVQLVSAGDTYSRAKDAHQRAVSASVQARDNLAVKEAEEAATKKKMQEAESRIKYLAKRM